MENVICRFSKYTLIHSSITSENYCTSAFTSMCMLICNYDVFIVVQIYELLISSLGKVLISIINTVIA